MKFTTILWDIDNTLLDFEYSMRESLRRCYREMTGGESLTEEMIANYDRINISYWKRLEKGEVTKAQLLNGRFMDWFAFEGITDIDPAQFRALYQVSLGEIFAYMEPDALDICKDLSGHVKQYVVTNGVAKTQRNKLMLSGFMDVFDDLFISEEIGANKPESAFFEGCFAKVEEKDLSKILLVGDSLSSDIKGANNAGIAACWYNPGQALCNEEVKIDYEIRSLKEVYGILEIEG